jgi:hypothetical protein
MLLLYDLGTGSTCTSTGNNGGSTTSRYQGTNNCTNVMLCQ